MTSSSTSLAFHRGRLSRKRAIYRQALEEMVQEGDVDAQDFECFILAFKNEEVEVVRSRLSCQENQWHVVLNHKSWV